MYTYQDLIKVNVEASEVGQTSPRGAFCRSAIDSFRGSKLYQDAQLGESYYNKHNVTIEQYQKFLYTLSGNKVSDIFSSNYKLKTTFFRRLVIQQVQYVLGNGVTLKNTDKSKLGKDFDFKLQTAAKRAMAGGRAFGFWNLDHLEVFGFADTPSEAGFCPLYDENTAELMAGVRFWFRNVGDTVIFRATLYEADGFTEYIQSGNKAVVLLKEKQPYKTIVKSTSMGVEEVVGENYSRLPIVELFANDSHESELIGIKECIDCYDFVKSGLANDINDMDGLYWIIQNSGGMEDPDLAQFIHRLKTVRAVAVEDADQVSAHTQEVPYTARQVMLDILRRDIYEDFQSADLGSLSAAAKTAQEIRSAYQAMDNKCTDFEYYLIKFVEDILVVAGITDEVSFTWNKITNQAEETSMVLSAAQFLTPEMIIKKLPFLTPEEAEEVINGTNMEAFSRFNADPEEGEVVNE